MKVATPKQKLTPKQARFVEEYLCDLNATQAAIRAGYSKRTATAIGAENLRKPHVAAAIAERQGERAQRTEITQDRVLQELARIAFADIRSLFTWDEERACYVPSVNLTDDEAAVVSAVKARTAHFTTEAGVTETRIELELKTYDKLGALEKIAKHLGMFVERVEHSGRVEVRTVRLPAIEGDPAKWSERFRVAAAKTARNGSDGGR